MRQENRSHITNKDSKEKLEREQSFLAKLATINKKESQTEEKSPIYCQKQVYSSPSISPMT